MAVNSITARAASALPFVGIVLALANWNARPERAWAWTLAIAAFVAMVIVRYGSQLIFRRSSGDPLSIRNFASITNALMFGALMMIIPLAVRVAQAYSVVDDPDSGRRATMIILGAYLTITGNALPRMLPPVSSMSCDGARVQAFQRLAGWTWVISGLGFATAWLVLPIDAAKPVSLTLMAAAMIVSIVQILRLRKPRPHAPA